MHSGGGCVGELLARLRLRGRELRGRIGMLLSSWWSGVEVGEAFTMWYV